MGSGEGERLHPPVRLQRSRDSGAAAAELSPCSGCPPLVLDQPQEVKPLLVSLGPAADKGHGRHVCSAKLHVLQARGGISMGALVPAVACKQARPPLQRPAMHMDGAALNAGASAFPPFCLLRQLLCRPCMELHSHPPCTSHKGLFQSWGPPSG